MTLQENRETLRTLGYSVDGMTDAQIDQALVAQRDLRRPVTVPAALHVERDGQTVTRGFSVRGTSDPRPSSLTAAAAVYSSYGEAQSAIASRVRGRRPNVARDGSGWQREAWALLDEVGELHFAGSWVAAALSRVRLVAAKMTENGEEPRVLGGHGSTARYRPDGSRIHVGDSEAPPPNPQETAEDRTVAEIVAAWAGGPSGQEQILSRAGWHLGIAGDTWLVAREATSGPRVPGDPRSTVPGDPRVTAQGLLEDAPLDLPESGAGTSMRDLIWATYSNEEVSEKDGVWSISDGGEPFELDPTRSLVVRCWRPHPRRFREASSAVRAALPILRELRGLTAHVGAQIDSRLAGAGLLLLPQSMTFAGSGQDTDVDDGTDPFIRMLMEAMVTPIKDRDSAAAVVPIVIKVPDESIGKAQYIRFGDTTLDKTAKDLREEAIHRLALSLDLPQEVVTGLGETNHWSAWQIDESAIKMHVAPVAATFCHALTVGYLHPLLKAMGVPDAEDYLFWFDTTPLVLRPDRTESAMELYDRAVIGAEALRRESGFKETDAPSESERKEQLLIRIVERAPTMAPAVLPLLGIDVPRPVLDQAEKAVLAISGGQAGTDPIRDARQITADERRQVQQSQTGKTPSRSGTDKSTSVAASAGAPCQVDPALAEACHMSVLRALEYAGKRLVFGSRKQQGELRQVQADNPFRMHMVVSCNGRDLDQLLAGAWTIVEAGRDDADRLVPVLDRYVRQLLEHQVEHSPTYLRAALQQAQVCLEPA